MPTLAIDVEARFAKFQDGLDSIQRDVGRTVAGLEKSFARIGTGIGALVAGAGAGSLAGAFKSTVDQLDAFNDASDRTGASVEDLSALLNTLKPYGTGLEDITNVAGLLTKAMRGADEETSKAAGAFKALGINTRDAAGNFRPIQDVLDDLAQAFNDYADGTNKTALAQDILGKGAAQYIPMLKDLANAQRASATVTTEQAQAAEKFNVEMGKLGVQIDAFRVALVGPVLTSLNNFIAQLRVGTDAAGGFFSALTKFGLSFGSPEENIDRLTKKIAGLNEQIAKDEALASGQGRSFGAAARKLAANKVTSARKEIDQALKDLQYFRLLQEQAGRSTNLRSDALYDAPGVRPQAPRNAAEDPKKAAKEQVTEAQRLLETLQAQLDKTRDLTTEQQILAKIGRGEIEGMNGAIEAQLLLTALRIDKAKELEAVIANATRAEQEDYAAVARMESQARTERERMVETIRDAVDPTRALYRELERIEALFASGDLDLSTLNARRAQLNSQVDGILSPVAKESEKVSDAAKDLGFAFQSAFEDAIIEGKRFSDVLRGIAEDIARIFIRQQITQPIANFISNSASSLFGGQTLGGMVLGAAANSATTKSIGASSAGVSVIQNNQIGSNLSRTEVQAALEANKADTIATISKSMRNGGSFAYQ